MRSLSILDQMGRDIQCVKADGSGGHSWCGFTMTAALIKEKTSDGQKLQVSFGTSDNVHGGETYVLLREDNGYSFYGSFHNDLKKRLKRIHNS